MTENPSWTCWRDRSHRVRSHRVFGWPLCAECGATPAYHERPDYLPDDLLLPVFVLVPDTRARAIIAPGSGIVGLPFPNEDDRTTVYYEGWVHGASQYATRDARGKWEAGVEHAADRLVTQYPTSAMAALTQADLWQVGTYGPVAHTVDVFDEDGLTAWLESGQ